MQNVCRLCMFASAAKTLLTVDGGYGFKRDTAAGEPLDVQFIDYEYTAYNPRAYDIANHFCEYAGPECNYANYPTLQEASHFVRQYLLAGSDVASLVSPS